MKIRNIFLGIFCATMIVSCTDYLDVSPDSGLTEDEIFTSYSNTLKFFNTAYQADKTELDPKAYNCDLESAFPIARQSGPRYLGISATTDLYDSGRSGSTLNFKRGVCASGGAFDQYYDDASSNNFRPIYKGMFTVIRICNRVLMNLDKIEDANSQKDIEDLRGQAYFVRAYAHFIIGTHWGPFPYITDIMTPENFDRPRLSAVDYYKEIANDCDRARETFEAVGLMRRDPGPGQSGHLQDANQNKPTGVAALALKSRALLYRASPLSNPEQNPDLWKEAADAAAEALKMAKQYQYDLLPWEKYYDNFYGAKYTNEQLWSWISTYNNNLTRNGIKMLMGSTMSGNKECWGEFPTQNLVDMYDTKWGDVLVTEADRAAAAAIDHYDEQDPYKNRDPRFAGNIFYNQADITWNSVNAGEEKNKFNCYYTMKDGQQVFSTFAQGYAGTVGDTKTGYCGKKRFGDWHAGKKTPVPSISDVLFRMVELYLNYAEAVNEGYGGPSGKSPNGEMTALEALNVVRGRVSQDLVLKASDPTVSTPDAFRKRIQKERAVEFDQEGHHRYFDIRRWKIAGEVMSVPLYGISIEQINEDTSLPYKQRFKHTRYKLQDANQPIWNDYMYFWPFSKEDYFKFNVFDTSLNPYW